jgi:hypothetical protein
VKNTIQNQRIDAGQEDHDHLDREVAIAEILPDGRRK